MPVKITDGHPGHPMSPIVFNLIKGMVKCYHDGEQKKDPDEPKTNSVWVSKTELMQLLTENSADGLRIYFGRHEVRKDEFSDRKTVILVATQEQDDKSHPTSETSKDCLNQDLNQGDIGTVSYAGAGGDSISLCLPHCYKGTDVLLTPLI